jgi:hypothetical protein
MEIFMKWIVIGILSLLVTGCSKPMLRCDGHLTPINAPAKIQGPEPHAAPPQPAHDGHSTGSQP